MKAGYLGQIVTGNSRNRLQPGVTWALDNGCYSSRWDEHAWRASLEQYRNNPHCLFAVVPDVVADAAATDERWNKYADIVKDAGYPAAYVIQNGCETIPDNADAVFVGGDTTYKLSPAAQQHAANARNRGLWTHMGRVNSLRRLRFAFAHGYDSVDGTFIAIAPDNNLPRLLRYLTHAHHPILFGGTW